MKKVNVILAFLFTAAIFTSCNKDNTTMNPAQGAYPYSVRMTDAPAVYDAVNIDLQAVEVITSNGQTVRLNANAGMYNLLDFANGRETMIASGTLADAQVDQVRLILGSNNTVVVNGITHPLSTPSAQQSGLKIQVHQTLEQGVPGSLLLDFDANKSVVAEGNGNFSLKPSIRTVDVTAGGSISGEIDHTNTLAVVTATSNSNVSLSYSTYVNRDGEFTIKGMVPGNYTVTVTPVFPFSATTKSDVMVNAGATTDLGKIDI